MSIESEKVTQVTQMEEPTSLQKLHAKKRTARFSNIYDMRIRDEIRRLGMSGAIVPDEDEDFAR